MRWAYTRPFVSSILFSPLKYFSHVVVHVHSHFHGVGFGLQKPALNTEERKPGGKGFEIGRIFPRGLCKSTKNPGPRGCHRRNLRERRCCNVDGKLVTEIWRAFFDSAKLAKLDMTRRCSHCGHNGHNSRTCPERGVKLFGVRLTTDGLIRKSVSMGNLSHYTVSSASPCNQPATPEQSESGAADDGYVSDGMVQTSKSRERKKGVPWTEDEHKMFLLGLQKLGKGDWRGISRNFVTSRTPTQVASHAQKYFLRQSNLNKRKRRSSLFDISADTVGDCHQRIPELPPSIHELSLTQSSPLTPGNFFEGASPHLAMSAGAFPVTSFAASLVNSPCLSLGMSRIEKPSFDKIEEAAKYSILKMADRRESRVLEYSNRSSHYSFPLPLWPESPTSKPNLEASPKIEAKEKEYIENSALSLSIAPPCVEADTPSPPPHTLKLDQSRPSTFHSNNMESTSNAISVV